MKKIILHFLFAGFLVLTLNGFSQNGPSGWCAAHEIFEESMQNDPNFAKNQEELETYTDTYTKQNEKHFTSHAKANSVVRIIPVVVHVIHTNGAENISKAQILSQIDVLNKDFRRLNADTNNTPLPFQAIAADSEIEFRMAQLDPSGNCTDGINRVYSPLTNQARNNVKSLIRWPRNMYLNIWIVNSIRNVNGTPGTVIGFAQFPGGADSTDGVVVAYNWMGTIGAAQSNGGLGRTATHEVGHWLNLRHIWGDDGGLCTGSDNVSDTPNQADLNQSNCPNFPRLDACTSAGNGVLFSDYMDYTNGNCQNIFTVGQAARMNAALSNPTSGRNNLFTPANLAATGVSTPTVLCQADFTTNSLTNSICENGIIAFTDASFNGSSTSRTWSFPGGTLVPPSSLSDSIVSVQYPTAGNFDVSLSVANATDSVGVTKTAFIKVFPNLATYSNPSYSESFETLPLPNVDWEIANLNEDVATWQRSTSIGFSGSACAVLENFYSDSAFVDELIGPTFNAQLIPNINFSFQAAYKKRTASDNDALKIWTSTDCGKTWAIRSTISAATLAGSNPNQTTYFTPTAATQWIKHTVNVANLINKTNARIKFQFVGGDGNNIYIDDINILTPLDVTNLEASEINLILQPNPSKEGTLLSFMLSKTEFVEVKLVSMLGQEIGNVFAGQLKAGLQKIQIDNSFELQPGIYFVKIQIGTSTYTQKLIRE
jgi:hypothetical protein